MSSQEKPTDDKPIKGTQLSKREEPNRYFTLVLTGLITAIVFLPYFSVPLYNSAIRAFYIPTKAVRHFIEDPVSDIQIEVPVNYEFADFKFHDLGEAVEIMFGSRMKERDSLAFNYTVEMNEANMEAYDAGEYKNDTLFVRGLLSNQNAIYVDGILNWAELYYTLSSVNENDLPFFVTQLLADNCFSGEIHHYRNDMLNMFVSTDESDKAKVSNIIHQDFADEEDIREIMMGKRPKYTLHFALFGANEYTWDIEEAVRETLLPLLNELKAQYEWSLVVEKYPLRQSAYPREEVDHNYPYNLSNIAELTDYYRETNMTGKHDIHLAFIAGDLIKDKLSNSTVDGRELYGDYENTILGIQDWGSLYISHPPKAGTMHYTAKMLKDTMWSFSEMILDCINTPNRNMSPEQRVSMWKRVLTVNYLTHYSNLLAALLNYTQQTTTFIDGRAVDAIQGSITQRSEVLSALASADATAALQGATELVNGTQTTLEQLGLLDSANKKILNDLKALYGNRQH